MVIAGSRLRAGALPLLMAAMYLTPAIYLAWRGGEDFSLDSIWILPLLGLVLSGPGVWQWSLPARWQWPLITWSVLVSITWPIVFLREADFALWILPLERVSNTSIGISPWQVGLNITYFAVGHNLGILFIDALCRWYGDARDQFRRHVLVALVAATTIAAVIAVYQGFVDLTFLNRPFWSYMLRASGTLGDAEQAGLGDRVLDRGRDRARQTPVVAVVSGADVRGIDPRHCHRVGVGHTHRAWWPLR